MTYLRECMYKEKGFLYGQNKECQTRCFVALFPESIKTMLFLAGLLTYSILERLPIQLTDSGTECSKTWKELTAAGLFRSFT